MSPIGDGPDEIHLAPHIAKVLAKAFATMLERESRPWPFSAPGVKMVGPFGGHLSFHFPGGRVIDITVTCRPDDQMWQEILEKARKGQRL